MSDIIIAVESGKAKRLLTKGKICKDDIVVTATGGKAKIHNCDFLFQNNRRTEQISEFDLSEIESAESVFQGASARSVPFVLPKLGITNKCKTLRNAFANSFITETEVPFSEMDLDTSGVEDFYRAFYQAYNFNIGDWEFDTSNGENFYQTFVSSANEPVKLISVKMNLSKAINLVSTFNNCYLLTTSELICSENTLFATNTFAGCVSLTKLTIIGVIGKSINLSQSPLTSESAISVITALKDFSGTDSEFTQTVTFSETTKAALEALGATAPNGLTWLQYITAKGWLYA